MAQLIALLILTSESAMDLLARSKQHAYSVDLGELCSKMLLLCYAQRRKQHRLGLRTELAIFIDNSKIQQPLS